MKRTSGNMPFVTTLVTGTIIFAIVTAIFNWQLALVELAFLLVMVLVFFIRTHRYETRAEEALQSVVETLEPEGKETLSSFPIPLLISDAKGRITWFNDLFKLRVLHEIKDADNGIEQFTSGVKMSNLAELTHMQTEYNGRYYTIYVGALSKDDEDDEEESYALYFVDNTSLVTTAINYESTKPVVLRILVENMNEVSRSLRESEKASLSSGIEELIEEWIAEYEAVMQRIGDGRYFIIMPEHTVLRMIKDRFSILKEVREYEYKEISGVTLSIGVGRGDDVVESEAAARQALDMSQGRGGDQAAVNTNGNYEFYGGISRGIDKRTRARSRIVSTSVASLMSASDIVFVMGHRFSDLDALGASIGMWKGARALGKEAYIVLQRDKTLAGQLLERFEADESTNGAVISPEQALEMQTKRSLLIIVDTHRAEIVESPELYKRADSVIVIDHHRQNVGYIDNAIIFFHDPAASSASEMVTDVLRYMSTDGKPLIGKLEAEALLAGIMLDTRSFILRTGVQTFEAAAYLRQLGADTVTVKRLFSNSIEDYQLRNNVISQADVYKGCAISIADAGIPDVRMVAAKAADELLNVNNVQASFVIFSADGITNISARSLGEVNVQVVMEKLGGGGHQTMAAAQLENVLVDDARVRLLQSIDQFYLENK